MSSSDDPEAEFRGARELLEQAMTLLEERSHHERDRTLASRNYVRWELLLAFVEHWEEADETRFIAAADLLWSGDLTARLARIVEAACLHASSLSHEEAVILRHDVAWLGVEVEKKVAPILARNPSEWMRRCARCNQRDPAKPYFGRPADLPHDWFSAYSEGWECPACGCPTFDFEQVEGDPRWRIMLPDGTIVAVENITDEQRAMRWHPDARTVGEHVDDFLP